MIGLFDSGAKREALTAAAVSNQLKVTAPLTALLMSDLTCPHRRF